MRATLSWFILLLFVILFSVFPGCGHHEPTQGQGKIISLLPSLTETVCELGLSADLGGVSRYCAYPESVVAHLPRMGDCIHPDVERIMRMRPRVVLLGDMQTEAEAKLRALGIPVLMLRQSTVADIFTGIDSLGRYFGRVREADSLHRTLQAGLDSLRTASAQRPLRRVFFVVGRNPGTLSNLYTVSRKSFLSELLRIAGGVSIFDSVEQTWCKVALEEVMRRDPEFIIETSLMGNEGEGAAIWKRIPTLQAVRRNRIYTLSEDYLFTPGPRMRKTAVILARILEPPLEPGESDR